VRNGAARLPARCQDDCIAHKKVPRDTTRASVKKEMAQPRIARSARIAERNLDTARVPDQPSTALPETVDKIIPPRRGQPEKAQIVIDRAYLGHRDLRIENTLTDENGDAVKLKERAHVEVTVATGNISRRK
jgi:hypothetical protein